MPGQRIGSRRLSLLRLGRNPKQCRTRMEILLSSLLFRTKKSSRRRACLDRLEVIAGLSAWTSLLARSKRALGCWTRILA